MHFYNAIVYKGADYPTQNPQILAHGRKKFTTEEIYKSLNFASESMQHRISLNFAAVIMDNHLLDLKERSYVQGNHYEQNITAFMDMVLRDITANEQNHKFYHVRYMDNVWPLAKFMRVSDLLCMSNLAHASKLKEHDDNDDIQGSIRRAAERR